MIVKSVFLFWHWKKPGIASISSGTKMIDQTTEKRRTWRRRPHQKLTHSSTLWRLLIISWQNKKVSQKKGELLTVNSKDCDRVAHIHFEGGKHKLRPFDILQDAASQLQRLGSICFRTVKGFLEIQTVYDSRLNIITNDRIVPGGYVHRVDSVPAAHTFDLIRFNKNRVSFLDYCNTIKLIILSKSSKRTFS